MTEKPNSNDRIRSILVIIATFGVIAFNFIATTGRINGTTPAEISAKYSTVVTPAGYAFVIWSLIYAGMIAFSVYQLLPSMAVKYRSIRTFYISSCVLNCAWVYFWHYDQIAVCFVIMLLLAACLFLICTNLRTTETLGESWLVKAPFGVYFGWVTAAALVNLAVLLTAWSFQLSETAWIVLAVLLILFAALLGVIMRIRLANYFYPLAIAWALTGIAVEQSGKTMIVVAAALGVVVCLIATLSFVVNLPTYSKPQETPDE